MINATLTKEECLYKLSCWTNTLTFTRFNKAYMDDERITGIAEFNLNDDKQTGDWYGLEVETPEVMINGNIRLSVTSVNLDETIFALYKRVEILKGQLSIAISNQIQWEEK